MMLVGAGLYLILLTLVVWFIRRAWGKSMDDLFVQSDHEHHQVHGVIAKYPRGGTWSQYLAWMQEEAKH